jgi:hypothetical protein
VSLASLQSLLALPIYVGVALAGLISVMVLLINRDVLHLEQTFPELLRFPLLRILFAKKSS